MKLNRKLLLTAAVAAMGLVLSPGAAQAQQVETDANGNVIKILNLSVTNTDYDVDFVNGPASTSVNL